MKITIFKMDNHYSVKFATTLYEQSYKLRMGGSIRNVEDVRAWVDAAFMERVLLLFHQMHQSALQGHAQALSSEEEGFEEII